MIMPRQLKVGSERSEEVSLASDTCGWSRYMSRSKPMAPSVSAGAAALTTCADLLLGLPSCTSFGHVQLSVVVENKRYCGELSVDDREPSHAVSRSGILLPSDPFDEPLSTSIVCSWRKDSLITTEFD